MKNKKRTILGMVAPVLMLPILLLPTSSAHAEIKAGSVEISPFVGYNFFQDRQNLKDRPVFGGRIGYNFTDRFGIEGTWEYIQTGVDDKSVPFTREGQFTSPIDGVKINMYHLDLVYHLMPKGKFNPYITAGYGAANYSPRINNKNMSVVDFGAGVKYWFSDNIALRLDIRDNMVLDEKINNIQASFGLVFRFGGNLQAVAPIAEPDEADTTPPSVIFTSPYHGDSSVPVNRKANVAFSEDIAPASVTKDSFILKQGDTVVPGKVTSSASNATFTPTTDLEKGKAYTATVTTGVKDLSGNRLPNDYQWGFVTGQAADVTRPTVTFTSPDKDATVTPLKQKVNVAFSENIDPATITPTTFTLKEGAAPVAGKVSSSAATATFSSANNFEKGKQYTARLTTGVKDLAGNALAQDYVWSFTAYSAPKAAVVLSTLQNSHFDFNSAEISENGKTILNHNITSLKSNPALKLRIAGYTSAAGSEDYNQALSERRAAAVKDYLVKVGKIDGARISTIGYGKANPAKYEADPSDKLSEAALANMRVVVEVVEE